MSVLRRAWETRSTFTGFPEGGWSMGPQPGYGVTGAVEPGHGTWAQGMVWNRWSDLGDESPESAMRLSAVFACLRLLSEAIATLPLDTYRRENGARRPVRPRPGYLNFDPPQGSRTSYLSQVMLSLLTDGNAFVYTDRDELGVPTNLVVLDPGCVKVLGGRRYEIHVPNEQPMTVGEFEVMHIPGMTMPGHRRGVSPLRAAREVVQSGRKAQQFGTEFFDNSAIPPAIIEMPDAPDKEKARRTAEVWNETHGGPGNRGRTGVLMGGAKLNTVAISPEDAEWLESKRFGVSEIARFYGVPPHLIADASNSTSWGSGLAEQNLAFGQFSLRPWVERIEEAHGRLLTSHGLVDVFVKLNVDALLRASLGSRYESYAVGIENRFLTINEARRLEDMPPVSWGDEPASDPTLGGAG